MTTLRTAVEVITPETARLYLGLSRGNRSLADGTVEKYARTMRAGRWQLNGQTIVFDAEGRFVDGHHRLTAVIKANATVSMNVVRGVPVGSIFDEVRPRTMADDLALDGIKNANHLAAAANQVFRYERGSITGPTGAPSKTELRDVLERHPYLLDACARTWSLKHIGGRRAGMTMVVNFALVYDADRAKFFLDRLADGLGLDDTNDPIYRLRDMLIKQQATARKLAPAQVTGMIVKAWNAYVLGQRVRLLSYKMRGEVIETFPSIVGAVPYGALRDRKSGS